jgi:hypothetical protein
MEDVVTEVPLISLLLLEAIVEYWDFLEWHLNLQCRVHV